MVALHGTLNQSGERWVLGIIHSGSSGADGGGSEQQDFSVLFARDLFLPPMHIILPVLWSLVRGRCDFVLLGRKPYSIGPQGKAPWLSTVGFVLGNPDTQCYCLVLAVRLSPECIPYLLKEPVEENKK